MRRTLRQLGILAAGAFIAAAGLFAFPARVALGDTASTTDLKSQIDGINADVASKKQDLQQLNAKIDQYTNVVLQKKAEAASIQDEMALMDSQIARTQLSIDITKQEIAGIEIQMKALDGDISADEAHMDRERTLLGSIARKLYHEEAGRSTFEILMSYDSFSQFFDEMRTIADLQAGVNDTLKTLTTIRADLAAKKNDQATKRQSLLMKQQDLQDQKNQVEDQRSTKDNMLAETQSSELRYRYLLADLKKEQADADSEIRYLQQTLKEKVAESDRLKGQDTVLSWPVDPVRGISAYFHDPNYPFRNVFEHPAIDIRAYQGTPIRAAAAGIVAIAHNGGMGYSYIMLMHNNDISTVYGHVSKIVVREDTFVERGEIIGYSGGTPGTPGAGNLTTGPHLHFEVRLNGIPVDPLNYLVKY